MKTEVMAKQIGTDRWILETPDGGQVVDRKSMRSELNIFGLPVMSFLTKQDAVKWASSHRYEVRS